LELARYTVNVIADKKGENVLLLDIREITVVADYFVIASAASSRQMRAIISAIAHATKQELEIRPLRVEGGTDVNWALVDYGGVVVHLFSHEAREYYDLEGLWNRGKVIVNIL